MHSRLMTWSRGFYLAGIVLALVLVIPTAWFPFQLAKVALFSLCLLIAVVLFVLGGGLRELSRAHGLWGVFFVGLLPLSYLFSYLFSIDRSVGFSGFSIETDTILFSAVLFVTFVLSFVHFRTLRTVRGLLMVVLWAVGVAAVFQLVSILFGVSSIGLSTFTDRSVNLIGKWNDLGLLLGLLGVLLLTRAELLARSKLMRGLEVLLLVVIAILLAFVNFSLAWVLVLVFSLVLGLYKIITKRSDSESVSHSWTSRLPWYASAGVIISLVFIFFGSVVNLNLTSVFPVSSLEVRPSYSSTLDVINASRSNSLLRVLVGEGPNTFGESWVLHKPAEVNQSLFWSLDFNVGFSIFVTALGSVGLLGLMGWLAPLALLLIAVVRMVRLGALSAQERVVALMLAMSALFLFSSILFYVPSQNSVILAFVLAGAAYGFLLRQGQTATEEEAPPLRLMGSMSLIVLLVLVTLVSGYTTNRRMVAQAYVGKGTEVLSQGKTEQALAYASRAVGTNKTGDTLRFLVQVNGARLQELVAATSTPVTQLQEQFAAVVQIAIAAGQEAQTQNPKDYRPTLLLAQLYDYLATLKVQGAAASAQTLYEEASKKAPTNPSIPLSLARLAATEGNIDLTTQYLQRTLTLKPNYTDAILLVVQLNVAKNDIPNAIKAAVAAAQTAPGVAPIWFQLGLLYYSANDSKSAVEALTKAIAIEAQYANAKYFLGLSNFRLGDTAGAIKQFQDLAVSNPDNAEVKTILANLRAGKQPFEGIEPAPTPPQKRTTAPVSE